VFVPVRLLAFLARLFLFLLGFGAIVGAPLLGWPLALALVWPCGAGILALRAGGGDAGAGDPLSLFWAFRRTAVGEARMGDRGLSSHAIREHMWRRFPTRRETNLPHPHRVERVTLVCSGGVGTSGASPRPERTGRLAM
jgi:hypothetical protein